MRAAIGAAVLALALADAASAATLKLPLFGGYRMSVPVPAGTPTTDYRLDYPDDARWTSVKDAVADLEARAYPEAVVLVFADPARRSLVVRTTPFGRRQLDNAGAQITRLTEDVPDTDRCTRVQATPVVPGIGPGQVKMRAGVPCPYAQELHADRELVVEGLDRRGKRLFLAWSSDSRWEVRESADDQGRLRKTFEGRSAGVPIYVDFTTVVDARLRRLRIWEVDSDGVGREVAAMPFTRDGR